MSATRSLRLGLTGGIGSGKSTVAAMLVQQGAAIIDTDAIARELTLPGGLAIPAIRTAFGEELIAPDGAMNRARMRELAFGDLDMRRRLEAILHPLIGSETARRAAESKSAVQVFDVPLLVESGRWRKMVDRVLVVDCRTETQAERVARRPGWTLDMAHAVIAQQASRQARRAAADAVILNDGIDLNELGAQVAQLWALWCASD